MFNEAISSDNIILTNIKGGKVDANISRHTWPPFFSFTV